VSGAFQPRSQNLRSPLTVFRASRLATKHGPPTFSRLTAFESQTTSSRHRTNNHIIVNTLHNPYLSLAIIRLSIPKFFLASAAIKEVKEMLCVSYC